VQYVHRPFDAAGPWVLLGIGGVLGGLATWQLVSAYNDASAVQNARQWNSSLTASYANMNREASNGAIFAVTGSAAIVAGTIWLLARGPGERREEVIRSASITPVPGGAVLGLGGVL
jgi:hypothetical protein